MNKTPDHKQKSALAVAIAAGVGGMTVAGDAGAATYTGTLTQLLTYSNNSLTGSALNISSSAGLTWSYDDVTNLMTQTGGTINARATTAPTSTLFRQSITGLVIGNGAAATATTFLCTEGNFGAGVGASICGNYSLGGNFTNESTTTWGPGTAASRTIGGDDNPLGAQQSIVALNGMATLSLVGNTLELTNRTCTGPCLTGPGAGVTDFNNGYKYTFTLVPDVVDALPVIADDSITAYANTASDPLSPTITLGDGTAAQHTLAVTTNGTNGSCAVTPGDATGTVVYTPNASYTGPDSCVLTLTDSDSDTDTATISVTVNAFGANDDSAVTTRGQAKVISPGGNDAGFDNTIAVSIANGGVCTEGGTAAVTAGQNGAVGDIRITYTPAAITAGTSGNPVYTDVCTYTLDDGVAPADSADISIAVSNSVPLAIGGAASAAISTQGVAPGGQTATFTAPGAGGNPGDTPIQSVVATDPAHGSTSVVGNTITYTLDNNDFAGSDTFTYTITDLDGETSTSSNVTVTITDVLPTIADGAITTDEDTASAATALTIAAGNGSPAQHTLAVTDDGDHGSCTLSAPNATGTVTYTPDAGYSGTDSCVVTLTDGDGDADTATINVTVEAEDEITLPGGSSSMDLLSLSLLGSLPLLMRRRRRK